MRGASLIGHATERYACATTRARVACPSGLRVPPVLEALGLAEVEHNAKNNRMRAAAKKK